MKSEPSYNQNTSQLCFCYISKYLLRSCLQKDSLWNILCIFKTRVVFILEEKGSVLVSLRHKLKHITSLRDALIKNILSEQLNQERTPVL